MTTAKRWRNLKQKMGADSASWGSLAIWAIAITLLVGMMVWYTHR